MSYAIALIGILLSGVFATLVTYYLNTTKEHIFFMRKKAEELYLAADTFDRNLISHFLRAYPLIKRQISMNEYNDLVIQNADQKSSDTHLQAMMLVDIYFPNLQPALQKYLDQRDALNRILGDHKREYAAGRAGTEFFDPFHRGMSDLDAKSKELKQAIIYEARKFTGTDQLQPWKQFRRET